MRKSFLTIAVFVALLLMPGLVMAAAGTVTVSEHYNSRDEGSLVLKLACVAGTDGDAGTIPSTTIPETWHYSKRGYYLYLVTTVPGTVTAPDAADVSIINAIGQNLLTTDGTNLIHATNTQSGTPSVDGLFPLVDGALTVTVANQSTASATWDVYLYFVK